MGALRRVLAGVKIAGRADYDSRCGYTDDHKGALVTDQDLLFQFC